MDKLALRSLEILLGYICATREGRVILGLLTREALMKAGSCPDENWLTKEARVCANTVDTWPDWAKERRGTPE